MPYQKEASLVSTVSNGLYVLTNRDLKPYPFKPAGMQASQHFTALRALPDGSFLAGTYFSGIYRISSAGEVIENIST
jgi:hypothetical protein